jgi:streptogramin lyase
MFTRFPTPDPDWSPHGVVVDPLAESVIVWWAGRGVDVARLDPRSGETTTYGDTSSAMRWGGHTPVFDSSGDLWYSMIAADRIGHWDRQTDKIEHWDIPNKGGRPYGILVDQDDDVWIAEFYGCRVTRFDPDTETFREFVSPSAPCTLRRLGLDSAGRIWYGVFDAGRLGVLEPRTGRMHEYEIGRFSEPYEAWIDPFDKVWMTDGGQGGMLIRFDPETESLTHYPSPLRSDMPKMAITREGAIWYSNRSIAAAGEAPATVGVLYPDVDRMTTLGAYYEVWNGHVVGSGSPAPRTTAVSPE